MTLNVTYGNAGHGNGTRDKLLSIVEAGCGTLESFDTMIQNFNLPFGSKSPSKELPSPDAVGAALDLEEIVNPDTIRAEIAEAA